MMEIKNKIFEKDIKVKLSGGVYNFKRTKEEIDAILRNHDIEETQRNTILEALIGNDLYGTRNQRKFTRVVAEILKNISKDTVNRINQQIKSLFFDNAEFIVNINKFEDFGEFGDENSCFNDEYQNDFCLEFLYRNYPYFSYFTVRDYNDGRARCIMLTDGVNFYLTNFYYKYIDNNYRIFLLSLQQLLEKTLYWKKSSLKLPIYLNGDGILATTISFNSFEEKEWDKVEEKLLTLRLKCKCDRKVRISQFYFSSTESIWCPNCEPERRCEVCDYRTENYYYCRVCDKIVCEECFSVSDEDEIYCPICWDEFVVQCDICDGSFYYESVSTEVVDNKEVNVCDKCFRKLERCERCDCYTTSEKIAVCNEGKEEKMIICESCRDEMPKCNGRLIFNEDGCKECNKVKEGV